MALRDQSLFTQSMLQNNAIKAPAMTMSQPNSNTFVPKLFEGESDPETGITSGHHCGLTSQHIPGPVPTSSGKVGHLQHSPLRTKRWLARFEELKKFRKEYGHCCVPYGYAENRKLAWWVMNQRAQYQKKLGQKKHTWLSNERVAMLDAIGFEWSPSKKIKDNRRAN
jgi:hypothetical protein